MDRLRGRRCDRARQRLSLRLDGELSRLESRLLDDHLSGCCECAAFAAGAADAAALLRATPPERLREPVAVPGRPPRRVAVRPLAAAAVAALVVAIVGVGGRGAKPPADHVRLQPPIEEAKETAAIRRANLLAQVARLGDAPRLDRS